MAIISIQSQVVTGHVGNSAAVPALQLRGHDVWPIPTILLSHHPGHGGAQGEPLPTASLNKLIAGMAHRHAFDHCEAVISGYLATPDAAAIVMDVLARTPPGTPYLCDPVIGDDGRPYVSLAIAAAIGQLATHAHIVTPNAFELEHLTGQAPTDRAAALTAMRALQNLGPKIVIVTSFQGRDTPPGTLDILALEGDAAWRMTMPKIDQKFSGAGDLFSALFLSCFLNTRSTRAALGQSCSLLQEVLIQTRNSGGDELALTASRHHLLAVHPLILAEPLA